MTRVLVVGAGAVGGYFGARLVQAGRDVTFLVRAARAEVLREHGLVVRNPSGVVERIPVKTVTAATVAHEYDVILFAVKGPGLAAAVSDIAGAVGESTAIVPVMNGFAHLAALTEQYGEAHVLGGVCLVATILEDDGTIVQLTDQQRLAWGPLVPGQDARSRTVGSVLHGAGFETEESATILHDMWEKWVFLASLGAITCVMRGTIGAVTSLPEGKRFAEAVLGETSSIAAASGYAPREAFFKRTTANLTDPTSGLTSSMYRDLIVGRPVESEHILGEILRDSIVPGERLRLLTLARTILTVHNRARSAAD